MIKGRNTGYPKVDDDMPFYTARDCEPLLREAAKELRIGHQIIGTRLNYDSMLNIGARWESLATRIDELLGGDS